MIKKLLQSTDGMNGFYFSIFIVFISHTIVDGQQHNIQKPLHPTTLFLFMLFIYLGVSATPATATTA